MREVEHFINGSAAGGGTRKHDIWDPNTGEVQAKVALGAKEELAKAMDAALAAQPEWAATNPQRRARVMFRYKELVEANMDELAELLSSEHGKVIADAYRSAGLTPRFHEGAEWIYGLLAEADVAPDENIDAALDAFMVALARR